MGPGGEEAEPAWAALGSSAAPPIVWTGPLRDPVAGLLAAQRGVDFLQSPVRAPALNALLARLLAAEADTGWSGAHQLEGLDGPGHRFPPLRVLFLAHRVGATGTLTAEGAGGRWTLALQGGRVVGWTGLVGLLDEGLGRNAPASGPDELTAQLGAFIGQGLPPHEAFDAAARGLGLRLGRTVEAPPDRVAWTPEQGPVATPMPLPMALPRLIASGLAAVRSGAQVRRELGSQRLAAITATPPDDAPQSQWGLPPDGLRLVRDASKVSTLGELLGSAGAETDRAWQAVDLVLQLGLLALGQPEDRARPGAGKDDIVVEAIGQTSAPPSAGSPDAVADADPRMAELKAALSAMRGQPPEGILGVETAEDATVEGLDRLFIELSGSFHPDRFADGGPRLQRVAEACFTRVGDAREALRNSERRIELVERMRAKEQGKPWASAEDKKKAILIGKQGELALRRQAWTEAADLLEEAAQLDPTEFRYAFHAIQSGWRTGRLSPQEAIDRLMGFKDLTRGQQADVWALAGELHLREGREDAGYELLKQAVERNPELVDAQRRLRLRDMRQRKEDAEVAEKRPSALRSLLSWGKRADKDS